MTDDETMAEIAQEIVDNDTIDLLARQMASKYLIERRARLASQAELATSKAQVVRLEFLVNAGIEWADKGHPPSRPWVNRARRVLGAP